MRAGRRNGISAAAAVYALVGAAGATPPLDATFIQLTDDYSWGYKVGIKQPLGSYAYGRSVHQVSRLVSGSEGTPDAVFLVDERSGSAIVANPAVGQFSGAVVNPGGMAVFPTHPGDPQERGRIWFVYGGRANDLPFDLCRSTSVFDPGAFSIVQDDFVADQGSTAPCLHVVDESVHHTYRNGASSWVRTTVRYQRFAADGVTLEHQLDLGEGYLDPVEGNIGIEQLWTKYDPRHDLLMATWQWFHVTDDRFGSNPFVYSDDRGETWRRADGSVVSPLPVDYSEIDPVLVPADHLATGENANWHVRDLGVAPGGTPWITLPHGDALGSASSTLYYWFWDGGAWQHRELTGGLHYDAKPHALGVTRDYLVLVYSEFAQPDTLLARVSGDDGLTWSDPEVLDVLPPGATGLDQRYCWVSFIQPAERYIDNAARFIVGYYDSKDVPRGKNYKNNLRWLRLQVGPRSDFNADRVVDSRDFLAFLNEWTLESFMADFNDDGEISTTDVLAFLNAFVEER